MPKVHNPATISPPLALYSHAIENAANARWLHISGQVGVEPDGSTAEGVEAQADRAFANIVAILEDAGMGVGDLVKVTSFLTSTDDIGAYRKARDKHLGDARPASTLLVISALARPDLKIEIEAIAAKE
ncbi:MAG: RidA family protein [Minwuiales bacterium]|nr:RidA family protein [Minwuiales bacterium]